MLVIEMKIEMASGNTERSEIKAETIGGFLDYITKAKELGMLVVVPVTSSKGKRGRILPWPLIMRINFEVIDRDESLP